MKKMKLQILFGFFLLGNAALMQGMTRSPRVFSQLKPGVKFRSEGRAMYSTPASPQQMSEIEEEELVNPLREKRLQEERKKEQGKEPFQPAVELKSMEELDELDEDAQEEYIESLRNELEERKRSNRWQRETLPFEDAPRSELMQVKYADEKPKRQLIEYYDEMQRLKLMYNETQRQIEEEQEKTEDGLWKRFKSLFSSGSKEE